MDLSIIIVNWNSAEYVRRCVRSIREHTHGLDYEILVIDNASFDSCDALLKNEDSRVIFIQSEENLGFARANNRAAEAATGSSLLFLNPDTEVSDNSILGLHRVLRETPQAGIIGAKLLNGDGTVQTSCVQSFPTVINQALDCDWLRKMAPKSTLWGMEPLQRPGTGPWVVEVISGACMMITRDLFERVAHFSEDYFMYTEDIDLCYKVAKAGYRNYYVPDATVVHFGGGSSGKAASHFSSVMMRESIWRFLRKTRGGLQAGLFRASMFCSAVLRLAWIALFRPVEFLRRRRFAWSSSFGRWQAILQWSVGSQKSAVNSERNNSTRTRENSRVTDKSEATIG